MTSSTPIPSTDDRPTNPKGKPVERRKITSRVRRMNILIGVLVVAAVCWMVWISVRSDRLVNDLNQTVGKLERTVQRVDQNRIEQCEAGNDLRDNIEGLAKDLGARDRTLDLIDTRFPAVDCKNPKHPAVPPATTTTTTTGRTTTTIGPPTSGRVP